MSPRAQLSAAIRAAAAGGQPALIAYLTAGFPSRERFREHLRALARAAHVVEVGVPFTDPMADGVTIQRASLAALSQGVSLAWILEEIAALPGLNTPLLLMSYLNPLLAFGLEHLAASAARAGVCGFIVPDLPLDESGELRSALDRWQLALVQMVTPITEPQRLAQLCAGSQGFVYAVTMTGTTGRNVAVPDEVLGYLDRVRAVSPLPVCAGFGIRTRQQVERLRGHVDGVVVGSALVEVLERGEDPGSFLAGLRSN
ncbi:MAG: tryptophan synthase subunit alpha [Gammaproteobacteria bacterium]|nr:tryptophan synthase subunit alpha [Gammaproteobacteria bacterium]MBV8308018.1 tryptophan synthase subunit alpha [Gammaproteobacteria bacterium]